MSADGSVPTTVAAYDRPVRGTMMVIWVDPLITWLFVRTSPLPVSTMPVPEASACCRPRTVFTSTTPVLSETLLDASRGATLVGDAVDGGRKGTDPLSVEPLRSTNPNAIVAAATRPISAASSATVDPRRACRCGSTSRRDATRVDGSGGGQTG